MHTNTNVTIEVKLDIGDTPNKIIAELKRKSKKFRDNFHEGEEYAHYWSSKPRSIQDSGFECPDDEPINHSCKIHEIVLHRVGNDPSISLDWFTDIILV